MRRRIVGFTFLLSMTSALVPSQVAAQQPPAPRIVIHMKTSLAQDDAQICAVPNVAWAALAAGHQVRILVDASAVTSVTKGYGWLNGMFRPDSTALDRAALPERERESLAEQLGVPIEEVPRDYGEYFRLLSDKGVLVFGNRTMMLLYGIDPATVAKPVVPISLPEMIRLFDWADRIVVY